jgi:hypothetical protein
MWPHPVDGPWLVVLKWQIIDGRPECIGLEILRVMGRDEDVITNALLLDLKIAEKIAKKRAELAPPVEATGGLRRSTEARLREAAGIYLTAIAENKPPTKAVAEHYGISIGGASNLLSRARSVGLLPPTSRGKASGGSAFEQEVARRGKAIRKSKPSGE